MGDGENTRVCEGIRCQINKKHPAFYLFDISNGFILLYPGYGLFKYSTAGFLFSV